VGPGYLIQDILEASRHIEALFFQSPKGGHEDSPGFGPGVGLRAEADLARNHGGPEVSFRMVVLSRNGEDSRPMVEARIIFAEDA